MNGRLLTICHASMVCMQAASLFYRLNGCAGANGRVGRYAGHSLRRVYHGFMPALAGCRAPC